MAIPEAIVAVHIEKVTINVHWWALVAIPDGLVARCTGRIHRP